MRFWCKAILFDLDGVLVNSAELVERTWRNWANRHSLDPETVIAAAHGRRTLETVQLVAPALSADAEVASLETNEAMSSEGIYEIDGAREILADLPPGTWAVVTSGIRSVAEFRLLYMRLPTPSVMICADEIVRGKPDPEGYLKAAAALGRSADDCIVIEDAPPGIDAAHAAGMQVIAIASTYERTHLASADAVVDRLNDLSVAIEDGKIKIDIHDY